MTPGWIGILQALSHLRVGDSSRKSSKKKLLYDIGSSTIFVMR
jgi:hypothetical protein